MGSQVSLKRKRSDETNCELQESILGTVYERCKPLCPTFGQKSDINPPQPTKSRRNDDVDVQYGSNDHVEIFSIGSEKPTQHVCQHSLSTTISFQSDNDSSRLSSLNSETNVSEHPFGSIQCSAESLQLNNHWCADRSLLKEPHQTSYEASSLSNLPEELIYKTLSYIGPASNSLIHLSQVNKHFYDLLQNKIGRAMMKGTKDQFRSLLPKLSYNESNLSWFVRHVQCCWDIRQKLLFLKKILDKDFCIFFDCRVSSHRTAHQRPSESSPGGDMIVTSSSTPPSRTSSPPMIKADSNTIISPKDVDASLDLALSLMKGDPMKGELVGKDGDGNESVPCSLSSTSSFSRAMTTSRIKTQDKSVIQYCSASLENLVLILCGKCGGKAFKYAKMRLWLRNEVGLEFASDVQEFVGDTRHMLSGSPKCVSKDNNCTNVKSPTGGKGPEVELSNEQIRSMAKAKDEERMDKARLLMQLVISRELELSRKRQQQHR